LKVSGVPEYDAEGGVVGSIGFIANLSLDTGRTGIHVAIEESRDWKTLLERVANEVRTLIAFDSFAVSIVSENRRHLRQFFEFPPPQQMLSPFKWWQMPPFVLKMIEALEASAIVVDELFRDPEFAGLKETDSATKAWLERGFKHIVRCPVY